MGSVGAHVRGPKNGLSTKMTNVTDKASAHNQKVGNLRNDTSSKHSQRRQNKLNGDDGPRRKAQVGNISGIKESGL
jgi:hypothetical protein